MWAWRSLLPANQILISAGDAMAYSLHLHIEGIIHPCLVASCSPIWIHHGMGLRPRTPHPASFKSSLDVWVCSFFMFYVLLATVDPLCHPIWWGDEHPAGAESMPSFGLVHPLCPGSLSAALLRHLVSLASCRTAALDAWLVWRRGVRLP